MLLPCGIHSPADSCLELLRRRGGKLSDRGAYLHLQDHGDPVWYRNVKLRTIPKDEKIERQKVTPMEIPEDVKKREKAYYDSFDKKDKDKKK